MNDRPTTDDSFGDTDIVGTLEIAGLEPTDSFRTSLAAELRADAAGGNVTTLQSARDSRQPRNRTPLILATAAAVVLVVAIAVVAGRDSSDLTPADTTEPILDDITETLPAPAPPLLTNSALFDALENRRWLAIERFDDPVPTSLISRVTISGSLDNAMLTGHDGCNRYGGRFTLDGTEVTTDGTAVPSSGFNGESGDCGVATLQLEIGQRIELAADGNEFVLRADDGRVLARFVDQQSLPLTVAGDFVGTMYFDDVQAITFDFGGTGGSFCAPLLWAETAGRIVVELKDPERPLCGPESGIEVPPVETKMIELLATRPEVRTTPSGLLLTNGTSAIQLRRLPEVELDPRGVTIAAGAVFGIRPGVGVTVEDVLGAVTPELGDPDLDTGWIDDPSDGQMANCELNDYRELVWDDLVFGFWSTGSRTLLLFWHIGDGDIVSSRIPDIERPDADSTGLRTEVGVGLGDSIDDIPVAFNVNKDPDPNRPPGEILVAVVSADPDASPNDRRIRAGMYLVIDGTVVAFGAEDFYC